MLVDFPLVGEVSFFFPTKLSRFSVSFKLNSSPAVKNSGCVILEMTERAWCYTATVTCNTHMLITVFSSDFTSVRVQ